MEVDLPDEEDKLVVNCYFAADSVWDVRVWRNTKLWNSDEVLNTDSSKLIRNATALVLEGSNEFPLEYAQHRTYRSIAKAEAGKQYTLKVSAPGYETVTSTIRVPEAVPILDVKRVPIYDLATKTQTTALDIRFQDPPGEENYYAIAIYVLRHMPNSPTHKISMQAVQFQMLDTAYSDVYLQESYHHYKDTIHSHYNTLFSDRLFNGKEYTFRYKTQGSYDMATEDNPYYPATLEYWVFLKSISYEYYNYRLAYNKQKDRWDIDPYVSPVQVFNNIENGYGIFASYNQSFMIHKVR